MDCRTVVAFLMRHGDKKVEHGRPQDALSELGIRQVEASARTHLAGVSIVAVAHSEMERAQQTARIAMRATNQEPFWWLQDEAFGFAAAACDAVPDFPMPSALAALKVRGITEPTVWDLLMEWPPAWLLRGQTIVGLKNLARQVLASTPTLGDAPLTMFVAGHSPGLDMVALDPRTFPRMGEADFMKVTMEVPVGDGPVSIVKTEYLQCPKGVD